MFKYVATAACFGDCPHPHGRRADVYTQRRRTHLRQGKVQGKGKGEGESEDRDRFRVRVRVRVKVKIEVRGRVSVGVQN